MAEFGLGANYTGIISVSEVSTNVSANQSTVRVTVQVRKNAGTGFWNSNGSARSWSVTGSGLDNSGSSSYDYRTSSGVPVGGVVTIAQYDRIVTHNTNGTGFVNVNCSISHVDNPPGSGNGSQGLTLTDFPEPASGSFTSSNISVVSATLSAIVTTNGNGTSSTQRFFYREKAVGGSYTDAGTGSPKNLTNLKPATTYQWFCRTTNNTGNSSDGPVQEFTTLPAPSTSAALLSILGIM